MPVKLLGREEMRAMTASDRYLCAMLDERGGDLHPLSYARGLARAAISAGAAVHGETKALSLSRDGSRWRITTPRATVIADKVLLATNGFTDDLWPALRRTIVPVFSSIAATAPLSDEVARAIMPGRQVAYESGHITVYYRIDQRGRLLMGGRGPMHWIKSPSDISYLIRYAERLWPQLKGVSWTHGWNSRLAITADHYPHVHEPAENLLISLGCNGRGVALSTAMGAQLARRLVGGKSAEIDMPITDIEPIPMHAFWPVAVTATVLAGRARDRLGI